MTRNSSTPFAADDIGRDNGIERFRPFCNSKINLPDFTPHVFGEASYGVPCPWVKFRELHSPIVSDMGHLVEAIIHRSAFWILSCWPVQSLAPARIRVESCAFLYQNGYAS